MASFIHSIASRVESGVLVGGTIVASQKGGQCNINWTEAHSASNRCRQSTLTNKRRQAVLDKTMSSINICLTFESERLRVVGGIHVIPLRAMTILPGINRAPLITESF